MKPNRQLLQDVNEARSWRHYKKTKSILAKKLSAEVQVNTMEGRIACRAGDYLCRGPSGEHWCQKESALLKKYNRIPDADPDAEGWLEFRPKPDAQGVMAVSMDKDFHVEHPDWGTFNGKAGDFLVKSYEDRDVDFPGDIWIVDRAIFEATYEKVED